MKKKRWGLQFFLLVCFLSAVGTHTALAASYGSGLRSALDPPQWDVYQICDSSYSPKKIILKWDASRGKGISGIEIWRKQNGGRFRRLRKIGFGVRVVEQYIDRAVSGGRLYRYKLRYYRNKNGKTYYTAFSSVFKRRAVNSTGRYRVKTPNEDGVVVLVSDAKNGILELDLKHLWAYYSYREVKGGKEVSFDLTVMRFSRDGVNWSEPEDRVKLNPGKRIWIAFAPDPDESDSPGSMPDLPSLYAASITSEEVAYNDLSSTLTIDLKGGSANASVNLEMYH